MEDLSQRHALDIGLREIVAGKQQRRPAALGECIGKAVAVIKPGRVASLAEAPPCQPCDLGLILIDRDNLDAGAVEQQIELAPAGLAFAALDHHRRFQQIRRGQKARRAILDGPGHHPRIRLVQQNREEGRGIDDDQDGNPASS
jgi:hypothetical protein